MTFYSTVTSKGQITLPAKIRKDLNLQTGQRVGISMGNDGKVAIEVTSSVHDVRSQLRANLEKQGFTSDKLRKMAQDYKNGDGFEASLMDKYNADR